MAASERPMRRIDDGSFMSDELKSAWREFIRSPPGERFERRFRHVRSIRRSGLLKWASWIGGSTLIVIGLVALPAPGPGTLVLLAGGALLAQESLYAARALDRLELLLRSAAASLGRIWSRTPTAVRALAVLASASLLVGIGFGAWRIFFDG
jgi:hypothetical protein